VAALELVQLGLRNAGGQPACVRDRRGRILPSLPDADWNADRGDVEAPRPREGARVVEPPLRGDPEALGHPLGDRGHHLGPLERFPVGRRELLGEAEQHLPRVGEDRLSHRLAFEQLRLPVLFFFLGGAGVRLAHAGREVEALGVDRRRPGEHRCRNYALGKERGGCQRERASARDARGPEPLQLPGRGDRRHVVAHVGDPSARPRGRAAGARAVVGDQPDAARFELVLGEGSDTTTRVAVMPEHREAVERPVRRCSDDASVQRVDVLFGHRVHPWAQS
jgi:hypothetical protein